jgi:hypothetical protein
MLDNVGQTITAVGGLGTAAFGLVDATKPISGINHAGFSGIRAAIDLLTPGDDAKNSLPRAKIQTTLEANWMNGTDLASQKAIAKSLIKLHLSEGNAAQVADASGVSPDVLTIVSIKVVSGEPLSQTESDVFGRFDLIVTALLDEAYQRADQTYRNATHMLAMFISVILALAGAVILDAAKPTANLPVDLGAALIVGLLATPLSPIAKDLSSALVSAVSALQTVRK